MSRKRATMSTATPIMTMYGPRGWTVEAQIDQALHHRRNGFPPVTDFWRFDDATACDVRQLVDSIPAPNLDDRQNFAPSCGELLRACLTHDGDVSLSGYVVGPGRYDERLSVDGLRVRNCPVLPGASGYACEPVGEERMRIWQRIAEYLNIDAQPTNLPDEMMPCRAQDGESGARWWLWWD